MLQSHIQRILGENLGHSPTDDQLSAIKKIAGYVIENTNESIFLLTGYAGTGKTSLINALVKTLTIYKYESVLLAPTGRAAKVLSSYSGKPAYTIHKHIYRQRSSKDGMGRFDLDRNKHRDAFFIIDEASMISNELSEKSIFGSGRLLDDLIEYVYKGRDCKLILVGDTAQLPPVGSVLSPALSSETLGYYGFNIVSAELKEVVRQDKESGILANATSIRQKIVAEDLSIPGFRTKAFDDIIRISGEDLLEEIDSCYSYSGTDGTLVLVNSNRMANRYNQGIRNRVLYREDEVSAGDMIMVVKNNYFWAEEEEDMDFIANGDVARIKRISRTEEMYGFRFADMILEFADHSSEIEAKVILDTLDSLTPSLSWDQNQELFGKVLEDYQDLSSRKKQYDAVKEDPFFNALQIKFAYAVTCHKAQGGQWERVFVDQGMFNNQETSIDYLRWLYTALTRSTDKLYLVNFSSRFFEDD